MSVTSPSKDLEDDVISVPDDVCFKEKTRLCRWGAGCSDNTMNSSRSSRLRGDSADDCAPCRAPSSARPARCLPSAKAERLASLQSGIDVHAIRLLPVKFDTSDGKKHQLATNMATPLSQVLELDNNTTTKTVTAVFCIRRAGCGSCRDHGMELAKIAKQFDGDGGGDGVQLIGILKKDDANAELIEEFYREYFPFPIYQDEQWDAFKFLGRREISAWNLLAQVPRLVKRYHEKNIKNTAFGGDIFTQGGILLFDVTGKLRYVYYEQYGEELDVESLTWAMRACQTEK
jgi:AhpC/TSA antioxidant enzyme